MRTEEDNLVISNMGLAYKLAYQYSMKLKGYIELEDLQSICFVGLVKASKTYDNTKSIEFSTYAYNVMKNEILNAVNKNRYKNNEISLESNIADDLTMEDSISSDFDLENLIVKNNINSILHKFISELTEKEQDIVLSYSKGNSFTKIAKKYNCSYQNIIQIYRKAMNKLRYKFFKQEGDDL